MRIIQRRKGNKSYYYLQYSYRKDGKVKTKENYLGSAIPKNIEDIKKELKKDSFKHVSKKFLEIKKHFQKEWTVLPPSIKEKEKQAIAVAFTYNTNAIEGSTITLEETREILEDHIAPNKSLRDIKETEAHAKVFLKMLGKKERITKELLLAWHQEIFEETKPDIAGRLRDYSVKIGEYRAPDWQDVKELMKKFLLLIDTKEISPVELAARAHYRFEKIHPFGDGNGRIGRLLFNHVLWHHGYPMLIIEYTKRRSYYKALTKNEEGFVQYFFRRYLATHKKRYSF